jgi:hypothetical protein
VVPRNRKPPKPTKVTIAIDGEGVGLKDVSLRQLAELLEATAATFEAVAAEKHLEPPKMSLAKAKHGSAAYELVSEDRQAPRVVGAFMTAVRHRGKGSSPQTRNALGRLHRSATRTGVLRLDQPDQKAKAKPIYLAAPVAEDETKIEEATVVFARVVGVNIDGNDKATVTLRYDDGGSGDFEADSDLITKAAALIARHVEARVTFLRGESRDWAGCIEGIKERRPQSSFMAAIEEARHALIENGIVVDSKVWLSEDLDNDDELVSREGNR